MQIYQIIFLSEKSKQECMKISYILGFYCCILYIKMSNATIKNGKPLSILKVGTRACVCVCSCVHVSVCNMYT